MALTKTNVDELNNMNEAARRAGLGTVLETLANDAGTVSSNKQVAHQINSKATDVAGIVADFNSLLKKMQEAGIMA